MNYNKEIRKRILLVAVSFLLIALLVSGATMAWFNDSDTTGTAEFTAGTLLIESDTLSFFGIDFTGSSIYEVLVGGNKVTFNKLFTSEFKSDLNSLAFDRKNRRLYYTHKSGNGTKLYYYDFNSNSGDIYTGELEYGNESHTLWGATFGMGYYWYINVNTDDLYRVSFNSDGTLNEVELYHENFTGANKKYGFGDISMEISDGVIYASSSYDYNKEFFTYDIRNKIYTNITGADAINLQLALGADGQLYGHETREYTWYTVDKESGDKTLFYTDTENNIMLSDLASNYQGNWNPGDMDLAKFFVKNIGSKKSYVRAKLHGVWLIDQSKENLNNSNITFSLCDNSDWTQIGDYYYYNGILASGEKAVFCVNVNIDGPSSNNSYQDRTYELYTEFEAIQTTNGASADIWGLSLDNDEWLPAGQQ